MAFWEYDFSLKDDRRDEFVKHHSVRQNAIRELVRSQSVRTQRELVSLLKKRGFVCTQATVSRDTTEMDLQKLPEGGYVLSEDVHLQRMLSEFVTEISLAGNLVVVHCHPSTAPAVASAIDDVDLDFCVGTIAGDDTVFLAVDDVSHTKNILEIIEQLSGME